jgi:Tetratricopeptide repeat
LMTDQAHAALDRLRRLKPDAASLALVEKEFNAAVAEAAAAAGPAAEVSIEESDVPPTADPQPVSARMHIETPLPAPTAVPQWPAPHVAAATAPVQPAHGNPLGDFVSDLENSLGDSFTPQPAAAHAAPTAQQHASSVQVPSPLSTAADRGIASTAGSAHGSSAHTSSAAAAAPALSPSLFTHQTRPLTPPTEGANPGVDLSDMFGELRQELEDEVVSGPGEDCETHYNLGVAFREMGLLDEAIGELQKVCQAVDHGHPFTQIMQTYTWLAQCFLDKGVPEAAIRWYEKALQIPNLDGETRTALHYEVANAYEAAQNKPWALKHFLEVYGSNIDYRDVSERIKALKS